jgi:hypothetical protein
MTDGWTYRMMMREGQWSPVNDEAYHHVAKANLCPTWKTCDDENSWVETWWRGDVQL